MNSDKWINSLVQYWIPVHKLQKYHEWEQNHWKENRQTRAWHIMTIPWQSTPEMNRYNYNARRCVNISKMLHNVVFTHYILDVLSPKYNFSFKTYIRIWNIWILWALMRLCKDCKWWYMVCHLTCIYSVNQWIVFVWSERDIGRLNKNANT